LNHLETLKRKKEEFFNAHNLKEVLNQFKETNLSHLDIDAKLDSALKILHTKLEPIERAIFLLKEVFDFDYDVLQETFDKKKEHCRQLLSRAKKKLQSEKPIFNIEIPSGKLTELFKNACRFGNSDELVEELKGDISHNLKK
jgi:RNA polymerase sigma-70 factor (ECF subfamily)